MQFKTPFDRLRLVLLLAPLAGCSVPMTSSNTYMVPLANGDKMEMSFKNGGLAMADDDGVRIAQTTLNPSSDKKHVVYTFELVVKNGVGPKEIKIEDITDDPVRVLTDDTAPKLVHSHWKLDTTPLDPDDPNLAWLTQLDDSIRVYRFTVTRPDGTQAVLKQPAMFPVFEKQLIRKMLGLDK